MEPESVMSPSWEENTDISTEYGEFVLLHKGNYADTYRAKKNGKYFLLKVPSQKDRMCISILEREYDISKGLSHPNIVSAIAFEKIEPFGPCLVIEYVDGITLSECRNKNNRINILEGIISALSYLHSRGIVHNDIKPDNILVTENGCKLIDFGLSDSDSYYMMKNLGCTPTYASPELLSQKGTDHRSDIYSLGLLIQFLFPNRYHRISRICTLEDPEKRYDSVKTVAKAIRRNNISRIAIPSIVLIVIGICILPYYKEYRNAKYTYETLFNRICTEQGISSDGFEQLDFINYITISTDQKERFDSCLTRTNNELSDRLIIRIALEEDDSTKFNFYLSNIHNPANREKLSQSWNKMHSNK